MRNSSRFSLLRQLPYIDNRPSLLKRSTTITHTHTHTLVRLVHIEFCNHRVTILVCSNPVSVKDLTPLPGMLHTSGLSSGASLGLCWGFFMLLFSTRDDYWLMVFPTRRVSPVWFIARGFLRFLLRFFVQLFSCLTMITDWRFSHRSSWRSVSSRM
jgi:hypothetical protein